MLPSLAMGVLVRGDLYQPEGSDAFWDRICAQAGIDNVERFMRESGRQNKTQTIRKFDFVNPNPRSWHSRIKPGDYCDIWWKQRAPKIGFKIGTVKLIGVHQISICANHEKFFQTSISSSRGSIEYINNNVHWDHSSSAFGDKILKLALADGFKTIDEFRDYFTPNKGDEFRGNLLAW